MGVSRETALVLSTLFAFQVKNTNIHGVKLKYRVIIVIKTGTFKQYVQPFSLTASRLGVFRMCHRTLWQQKPPV